jgi:RHS repeat-associated protein
VTRRLLLLVVVALMPAATFAQSETVEYYGLDALGSVRVVFDASGHVVTRVDYTPFGAEVVPAAGLPDQRFAGLFRDPEAGLDYAQARSYQVRTGRFNAPDPVYAGMFDPQKWNRYAYARNSPLTFVDPDGRQAVPKTGCVTSAVIGGFTVICPSPQGSAADLRRLLTGLGDLAIAMIDTLLMPEPAGAPGSDGTIDTSHDEPGLGVTAAAVVVGVVAGRPEH